VSAQGGPLLPLLWIALTCVVLVPVWHQRLLPMLDTPNHLALVRGWHNIADPAWHISDFYYLRLRPVPYILFYGFIHVALYVVEIETANKLFLSLYLILFPLSILALARAFRRSAWLALPAFALAFNQNWIYGFSSYLMGTVFLFFSLALLVGYLRDGARWRVGLLAVTAVLAYFGHILPWFVLGLCAITLLGLHWRQWRRGLTVSLALMPSLLLAVSAVVEENAERTYMHSQGAFSASWRDFPTSVMELPKRVMELFPGALDMVVLAVIAATIVGLARWQGTRTRPDDPEARDLKWLLWILGLTYLTLPYNIVKPFSWWYVSPRVPSLMAPLALLLPVVTIEGRKRLLMVPVILCCFALPLRLARLYRDFSNRNVPFMQLVEKVPLGKTVFVVYRGMYVGPGAEESSGDPVTSAPVYWHFTSWPMALRGGYGPHVFDQGIPIRPKRVLKAPNNLAVGSFDIRLAPEFDYYLVHFPQEQMEREPSLKVVGQASGWTLFQRIAEHTDEP
jgi:hypothetical protein